MRFIDHREAGERLAFQLAELRPARPLGLAIPPAGARTGWEIAHRLDAPMDVLLVKEVQIPAGTGPRSARWLMASATGTTRAAGGKECPGTMPRSWQAR